MCCNCWVLSMQVFTLLFLILLPEPRCALGRCSGDSSVRGGACRDCFQVAGLLLLVSYPEKRVNGTQVWGLDISPCPYSKETLIQCAPLHRESVDNTQCLALLVAAIAIKQCFTLGLGWEECISQSIAHHTVSWAAWLNCSCSLSGFGSSAFPPVTAKQTFSLTAPECSLKFS